VAKSDTFEKAYGGSCAKAIKAAIEKNAYTSVVSPTSAFGKDVLPRVGGLMDVQPITDVIGIQDGKF
jgi:electron transfer flavoprotein alpha subunit